MATGAILVVGRRADAQGFLVGRARAVGVGVLPFGAQLRQRGRVHRLGNHVAVGPGQGRGRDAEGRHQDVPGNALEQGCVSRKHVSGLRKMVGKKGFQAQTAISRPCGFGMPIRTKTLVFQAFLRQMCTRLCRFDAVEQAQNIGRHRAKVWLANCYLLPIPERR